MNKTFTYLFAAILVGAGVFLFTNSSSEESNKEKKQSHTQNES